MQIDKYVPTLQLKILSLLRCYWLGEESVGLHIWFKQWPYHIALFRFCEIWSSSQWVVGRLCDHQANDKEDILADVILVRIKKNSNGVQTTKENEQLFPSPPQHHTSWTTRSFIYTRDIRATVTQVQQTQRCRDKGDSETEPKGRELEWRLQTPLQPEMVHGVILHSCRGGTKIQTWTEAHTQEHHTWKAKSKLRGTFCSF